MLVELVGLAGLDEIDVLVGANGFVGVDGLAEASDEEPKTMLVTSKMREDFSKEIINFSNEE